MLTLIRGAALYAPEPLGVKDVLLAGGKICAIQDAIHLDTTAQVTTIDGRGSLLFPGFIDPHVHIAGGGGEGGFSSRTPPIQLTDITLSGVTTVIGTLGTDGTTRSMPELLAKAYALAEEGITTFVQTGSYQLPLRTLTGSVTDDIVLVEKIIGAGEVAIADHRSSHPTVEELVRLVSDARLGGMLSGKAGTVNFHMGDSTATTALLELLLESGDFPISQLVPTHMNRNPRLFQKALEYSRRGGFVDFTTSTVPSAAGEIPAYRTLGRFIEQGISTAGVTFSSDGQGSLPLFDEQGQASGMGIGKVSTLYQAVVDAVQKDGIPLEEALSVITANTARVYKLAGKGRLRTGCDADIVLADKKTLEIHTVVAGGALLVQDGAPVKKGAYEA